MYPRKENWSHAMTPHIQKLIKQPLKRKGKGPCITSAQEPITRSEQHFKALFPAKIESPLCL